MIFYDCAVVKLNISQFDKIHTECCYLIVYYNDNLTVVNLRFFRIGVVCKYPHIKKIYGKEKVYQIINVTWLTLIYKTSWGHSGKHYICALFLAALFAVLFK